MPQLLIPDALRRYTGWGLLQYCRHLQCDKWDLEHCFSQRRAVSLCSHIAAESWACYIRRWHKCVVLVDVSDWGGMVCVEGREGGEGREGVETEGGRRRAGRREPEIRPAGNKAGRK